MVEGRDGELGTDDGDENDAEEGDVVDLSQAAKSAVTAGEVEGEVEATVDVDVDVEAEVEETVVLVVVWAVVVVSNITLSVITSPSIFVDFNVVSLYIIEVWKYKYNEN